MPSVSLSSRSQRRQVLSGRVRWKNAVSSLWRANGNGADASPVPLLLSRRNHAAANGELPATPARALRAWLTGFASCVRRQAFDEGRAYFHPQAYCFGSYASWCEGVDALVLRQWRKIWPSISGFGFDLTRVRYTVSHDGQWLCAMVPWRSTGYRPDRSPFSRRGRLTVVLTWSRRGGWQALHTHYSLNPGTSQTVVRHSRQRA